MAEPAATAHIEGTITAMSERPSLFRPLQLYRWRIKHGRKVKRVIEGKVDRVTVRRAGR